MLVPLLTIGIPTSATAAILLASFQIFDLQPGPELFEREPDLVWALVASLYVGSDRGADRLRGGSAGFGMRRYDFAIALLAFVIPLLPGLIARLRGERFEGKKIVFGEEDQLRRRVAPGRVGPRSR